MHVHVHCGQMWIVRVLARVCDTQCDAGTMHPWACAERPTAATASGRKRPAGPVLAGCVTLLGVHMRSRITRVARGDTLVCARTACSQSPGGLLLPTLLRPTFPPSSPRCRASEDRSRTTMQAIKINRAMGRAGVRASQPRARVVFCRAEAAPAVTTETKKLVGLAQLHPLRQAP